MLQYQDIQKLCELINNIGLEVRIRTKKSGELIWSSWITIPVPGYVDFGLEPIPLQQIDSILVKTSKKIAHGIRSAETTNNFLNDLIKFLDSASKSFEYKIKSEDAVLVFLILK